MLPPPTPHSRSPRGEQNEGTPGWGCTGWSTGGAGCRCGGAGCSTLDLCPPTSMPTKTLWLPLAWLVATATVTVTPVSVSQGHGLPVPDTPFLSLPAGCPMPPSCKSLCPGAHSGGFSQLDDAAQRDPDTTCAPCSYPRSLAGRGEPRPARVHPRRPPRGAAWRGCHRRPRPHSAGGSTGGVGHRSQRDHVSAHPWHHRPAVPWRREAHRHLRGAHGGAEGCRGRGSGHLYPPLLPAHGRGCPARRQLALLPHQRRRGALAPAAG